MLEQRERGNRSIRPSRVHGAVRPNVPGHLTRRVLEQWPPAWRAEPCGSRSRPEQAHSCAPSRVPLEDMDLRWQIERLRQLQRRSPTPGGVRIRFSGEGSMGWARRPTLRRWASSSGSKTSSNRSSPAALSEVEWIRWTAIRDEPPLDHGLSGSPPAGRAGLIEKRAVDRAPPGRAALGQRRLGDLLSRWPGPFR